MGRGKQSFQAIKETKKDRAKKRKAQGTLSDLRVSKTVKRRYVLALVSLFAYWKATESQPTNRNDIDTAVANFVEHQLAILQFWL